MAALPLLDIRFLARPLGRKQPCRHTMQKAYRPDSGDESTERLCGLSGAFVPRSRPARSTRRQHWHWQPAACSLRPSGDVLGAPMSAPCPVLQRPMRQRWQRRSDPVASSEVTVPWALIPRRTRHVTLLALATGRWRQEACNRSGDRQLPSVDV